MLLGSMILIPSHSVSLWIFRTQEAIADAMAGKKRPNQISSCLHSINSVCLPAARCQPQMGNPNPDMAMTRLLIGRRWPGYWILIGLEWHRCWHLMGLEWSCDLDTGLWLVESDHVTWILASLWSSWWWWSGWVILGISNDGNFGGYDENKTLGPLLTPGIWSMRGQYPGHVITLSQWESSIWPQIIFSI